ncbi:MAG: hypothetical protein A2233_02785 [Candidatus Kerfeldbacteria bacterium RIFOXYA2_FULL_38_24]|uniref:Fibronectin type-III domain-containing protein n=1 Tax=Candidatus Kerfeldbacteria bacterium RIFOXYB2_FULL_38_14 TaxID=1798547 RepID=A0A1G2BD11_9BACT|nr:MAG: hypothetical protein A2233_02785 [Candidatus Kerfeldbacteria bacterium RIFOXYA2_FULL_38_24]OGY87108.1 MAG: hypothetical protein A2319_02795 [Candidatus Kerfeldbacteria bacterium RIFOXYB2_FULL_38_14]
MKKIILASILMIGAFLFGSQPVNAGTVFFDDMENGVNDWTSDGLWHLQENPQDITISPEINPDLVSLPDSGNLPYAYSDDFAWWYGAASDGTFMGEWTVDSQSDKNGGLSDDANLGNLVSPEIDLISADNATLSFWHWWEVEGVDVDRYDLMKVSASTDGGTTWTEVALLNPANDVDGESWRPYSSGGLGQVGQWLYTTVDLSAYVGNTVKLQFNFDTVDANYNGFRGWLIDDVLVTDDATVKPSFDSQSSQAVAECTGEDGASTTTPAQFYVQTAQSVQVNADGDWYITPTGSDDYVAKGTAGITSNVYLNAGFYTLWVNFNSDQICPDMTPIYATVSFYGGAGQPSAQVDTIVSFYGENFVANSTVAFDSTTAESIVVSSKELHVTVPASLTDGLYDLTVTNPNESSATLAKALTVTSVDAPDIYAVSPQEIDNSTETELTISGYHFAEGAIATVGGVPVADLTVAEGEITGTVLPGVSSGYQNVLVINPDGQTTKLVGGVYVSDSSVTGYMPSGSKIKAPKKVKGIKVAHVKKVKMTVSWKKVKNAEFYVVTVKKGDTIITSVSTTKKKQVIKGLQSNKKYKVNVRAVGQYLGGHVSKSVKFKTK